MKAKKHLRIPAIPLWWPARLRDLGLDEPAAQQAVAVAKVLTSHQRWF